MKKYSSKIFMIATLFLLGGVVLLPATANALVLDLIPTSAINTIIANVANFFLGATSYFVAATGILLSVSVNITTHIKDLYTSATGIQSVWVTVRDLSSIFIIFMLLYSAIGMILGIGDSKFGGLILKIFLAGVFINFSLFFVRIGVDASNLVSLQFYQAIAPNTSQNWTVAQAFKDGGLSNIFMQNLKIPKIYKNNSALKTVDIASSIALASIGGIIMMVTAGISFLAASIAFIARTAILLFVMALSPLYFTGIIFPKLKAKVSDPLMDLFKGQLLFMPAYLGLMYIALRIISDQNFMNVFNPSVNGADSATVGGVSLGVIVQFTIAIIFINAPLAASIALGGKGMKWAPSALDISKRLGGLVGRKSLGWAGAAGGKAFDALAVSSQKSDAGRAAATVLNKLNISPAIRGGLTSIEKSKYGGKYSREDVSKADKERAKIVHTKVKEQERGNEIDKAEEAGVPLKDFKVIVSKMSTKELEDLDDKLKKPSVAAALSSKQAENILKSTELSETQKDDFKTARVEGLKNAITTISSGDMENILKEDFDEDQKKILKDARGEALSKLAADLKTTEVAEYMQNLTGKELAKFYKDKLTMPEIVIENLKPSHLKDMENLDDPTRRYIGGRIVKWPDSHPLHHSAHDFINKNKALWT